MSLINKIKNLGNEINEQKSVILNKVELKNEDLNKSNVVVDTLTISYMKYLERYNRELLNKGLEYDLANTE